MKTLIFVLSLFLAASTVATAQIHTKPSKEEAKKMAYVCPMHPKVTGKQGDKCSQCGMDLTNKEAPKMEYACPMHPKVTGKKGDKCSKCGMDLTKPDEGKNK